MENPVAPAGLELAPLLAKIREYNPDGDLSLVERAYALALSSHAGQTRRSGEAYFSHPYNVALLLAALRLDNVTIAAGLLHDVVEDCSVTLDGIREQFGGTMATILEGVTKISKLSFKSREEFQAENLRKLLFAVVKDIRVILVKLADRLHNIRTLDSLPEEKRRRIAQETLDIYVPLANRLGIHAIKSELEEVSFRHAEPDIARELEHKINRDLEERGGLLAEVSETLKRECESLGIRPEIRARSKNLYSVWAKLKKADKRVSEIYDLLGVRVIVPTLPECYSVLGIVHRIWRPIPGRFKDYIAVPKTNLYQSLHTTVVHPRGEPVEVQIRTTIMDRIAEEGIAAHWNYKEDASKSGDQIRQEISWLRSLINWHRDLSDAQEYIETIKVELYKDEVFVFTPQGDVKALVAGATPLDFAFLVHTEVGSRCVGARVNGKIVPLDSTLSNGDIVEVLTSKNAKPSKDWLKVVKSAHAKHKIKAYFKNEERASHFKKGREMLTREWQDSIKPIAQFYAERKAQGVDPDLFDVNKALKHPRFEARMRDMGHKAVDDFLVQVGRGEVSLRIFLQKLFPEWASTQEETAKIVEMLAKKAPPKKTKSVNGVIVSGIDDVLLRFAKCCSPLPGDPIVGFITRGSGVSVHRAQCSNLKNLQKIEGEGVREIEVAWDEAVVKRGVANYPTKIRVEAIDRPDLLHHITNLVSNLKLNIYELHAVAKKNRLATVEFALEVTHAGIIHDFVSHLHKIDGVLHVYRVTEGS